MILRILAAIAGVLAALTCLAIVNPWLAGAAIGCAVAAWGLLSDSEAT